MSRRAVRGGSGAALDVDVSATFGTPDDAFRLDAALAVDAGETLAVLGPSGSGKTLLLETIAGFHDHEGRVAIGGRAVTDLPPERRGLGVVFQDDALFPHATARGNVAFGRRYHDDARDPDVLLAELGIADLADRRPRTLSGGEKQRVALARALAVRPDALLLDEPLSALDLPTRRALRGDLDDAIADTTAVYVTHDRTTARVLGDEVAVVRDGTVVQRGTPAAVFQRPRTPFVARFVGANVLPAGLAGAPAPVAIRPEHVVLGGGDLAATVERVTREDATTRVHLDVDGVALEAFAGDPPEPGARVGVGLPADDLAPLDGQG